MGFDVAGVEFPLIDTITGISDDGLTIVGEGGWELKGWIATIPAPATGDDRAARQPFHDAPHHPHLPDRRSDRTLLRPGTLHRLPHGIDVGNRRACDRRPHQRPHRAP